MPWTKVDVSLREPDDEEKNHYDAGNRINPDDLPVKPGEQVAIFNGLEVLSGNSYTVERRGGVSTIKILESDPETKPESGNSTTFIKNNERKDQIGADVSTGELEGWNKKPVNKQSKGKPTIEKKQKKDKQKQAQYLEKDKKQEDKESWDKSSCKDDDKDNDEANTLALQSAWCAATGGVLLHRRVCDVLQKQNFWNPTPVQAATLPPAVLGRCNIIGAAPTGSGKTLAYMLPVAQFLLELPETEESRSVPLQALILTPTRELALQVHEVGKAYVRVGCIVGGLAHAKQTRVLNKDRPPVIVGTVGRLWELMSNREHTHLNDLSQLKFLIMDEADRMVQQGSFQQLTNILDAIHRANPMEDEDDEGSGEDFDEEESDEEDRMLGLPGIRGERRVVMLSDDILKQIELQKRGTAEEIKEAAEEDDVAEANMEDSGEGDEDEVSLPAAPPVHRQTFVYSATLTLQASESKSKKRKRTESPAVEGTIMKIMTISHAKGKTKIVDLSNSDKAVAKESKKEDKSKKASLERFRLPPGLKLQQIKCTQLHKDSHLYAYLMTTKDGGSGPSLVFCNSIAAVQRVGATLQALGVPIRMLHANMQQRARLKVMESLRKAKGRLVVVTTDVAARGLDVDCIRLVVHYDAARDVGTFVHRSGRTARGVGKETTGCSLSLVSSSEEKKYSNVVRKLSARFDSVLLDGRLLSGAQERVNLASKMVSADSLQSKKHRNNSWFREKATEAGIDIDEDEVIEEITDHRDQSRIREAKKARSRLKHLLSEPLQTQRYGKFLSTNSAAMQNLLGK